MGSRFQYGLKWILLAGFAGVWAGCSKQNGFIDTALVSNGINYYPVSSNQLVDTATGKNIGGGVFPAGDTLTFELDYFSQDSVKEVNLFTRIRGADSLISSVPFQGSDYSAVKFMDTLLLRYAIPSQLPSGTQVNLTIQILNENSLEITRSAAFMVQ